MVLTTRPYLRHIVEIGHVLERPRLQHVRPPPGAPTELPALVQRPLPPGHEDGARLAVDAPQTAEDVDAAVGGRDLEVVRVGVVEEVAGLCGGLESW